MFDRNFHFVSRTEGENYARFALTRLCLAGGVPVAASKDRERSGEDTPSERINPRRRGTYLPCPKPSTLISPGHSLFLFQCFLEAQVRRATVTSSRRRAGVFNEGRARMSSLNDSIFFSFLFFFFLNFAKNFHLKFMINAILIKHNTGKENQARERQELEKTKKLMMGSLRN